MRIAAHAEEMYVGWNAPSLPASGQLLISSQRVRRAAALVTYRRMRVVEDHPGVMVLAGVGALDRSKRGSRHRLGNALSSDPLKAHQQRKLALHGCGEGEGVSKEVEHRLRRSRLSRRLAIGGGDDAAASFSDPPAC
jgi:hypothetical protein